MDKAASFVLNCHSSLQDKIDVNGKQTHPLYQFLKAKQPNSVPFLPLTPPFSEPGKIEWNYVKFLVDRKGVPVKRFNPTYDPLQFEGDVSARCHTSCAIPVHASGKSAPIIMTRIHARAAVDALVVEHEVLLRKVSVPQVRMLLAGKGPLPAECAAHPGRKVCKVEL